MNCSTCKYSYLNAYSRIECRRYPPKYENEYLSKYPVVQSDEYCGEYKERNAK